MAPEGWGKINLGLPFWRYGLLAVIFVGGFLGLAFIARGCSLDRLTVGD